MRKLSAIWLASSRVGLSTRQRQPLRGVGRWSAARRWRMGSAKAAVLPVPVWATPSRSLALEHGGNGLRLDRRGGHVVLGCQRLQEGSGEAEVSKSGHVVSFIGCGVRPDAIAHERTLRPRWPWGTPRVIWDVLKEIEGVEPWLEAGRILKDPITQPDCSVSRCDGEVYGPSQLRSQAGSEFVLKGPPRSAADPGRLTSLRTPHFRSTWGNSEADPRPVPRRSRG